MHAQLREQIMQLIDSGQIPEGEQLPSEPELASMLGLSRATVNRALQQLVLDGVVERTKGRGTFIKRADSDVIHEVALVFTEDVEGSQEDHYFGAIYWNLVRAGEAIGLRFDTIRLNRLDQVLESRRKVDALLFINPPIAALRPIALQQNVPPTVVVGSNWSGLNLSFVDSDNLLGTQLAVSALAQMGHQRLMFVGACPDDSNSQDRRRGFELGCRLNGVAADFSPWSAEAIALDPAAENHIRFALSRPNRPTAVVAGGALLALHLHRIINDLNLKVGTDVSLVGYDDPPFLSVMQPPIATVVQPLSEMATAACKELKRLIVSPWDSPAVHLCQPELVLRDSAVAPRPTTPSL